MSEVPEKDYREEFTPKPGVEPEHQPPESHKNKPKFDLVFEDSMGTAYPWTFDEVSYKQRLLCSMGYHKGRVEVMGGESCFFCSYCGEIER
jgi:hypothetical protein